MTKLETLRKKKKLTLRALSEKTGVSYQFISMIEHGNRNLTIKTAKALAPALGCAWYNLID